MVNERVGAEPSEAQAHTPHSAQILPLLVEVVHDDQTTVEVSITTITIEDELDAPSVKGGQPSAQPEEIPDASKTDVYLIRVALGSLSPAARRKRITQRVLAERSLRKVGNLVADEEAQNKEADPHTASPTD